LSDKEGNLGNKKAMQKSIQKHSLENKWRKKSAGTAKSMFCWKMAIKTVVMLESSIPRSNQ